MSEKDDLAKTLKRKIKAGKGIPLLIPDKIFKEIFYTHPFAEQTEHNPSKIRKGLVT